MTWSSKFKKEFVGLDMKTDEERANELAQEFVLFAILSAYQWKQIDDCKTDIRGELLGYAGEGDRYGFDKLLLEYGISTDVEF